MLLITARRSFVKACAQKTPAVAGMTIKKPRACRDQPQPGEVRGHQGWWHLHRRRARGAQAVQSDKGEKFGSVGRGVHGGVGESVVEVPKLAGPAPAAGRGLSGAAARHEKRGCA